MKRLYTQVAILILLAQVSCVFQPDLDENFRDINPEVDVPPVQINLAEVGDTIHVYSPVEFNYSIEGVDEDADYWILATTGDDSYGYILQSLTGSFLYDPSNKTAFETLTLKVLLKSGTGSLADQLGAELIVFEESWVLQIDTRGPEDIFITSIKPDDGSLKIKWTPYTRANFKRFHITKIRSHSYETYVIEDQNSNYFYDSSFVGGETLYRVTIETQNGLYKISSNVTYIDNDAPALVEYQFLPPVGEPGMRVYFSASKYPANVARYEVYESAHSNVQGNLIFTTTNPMDTSFTMEPVFGMPKYIAVRTVGILKHEFEEIADSPSVKYVYGEEIPAYHEIFMAPQIDRFFTKTDGVLQAFSIGTNAFTGTLTLPPNVQVNLSPLQDKILAMNDYKLYIWDALTLTLTNEYDFSTLLGSDEHFFGFGLTKDNRLLLSRGVYDFGITELVIVDLASQALLNELSGFRKCKLIEMADDNSAVGNYGNNQFNRITKIENGELTFVGVSTQGTDPLVFNPDNQAQAIYGNNQSDKITIKDIATLNTISQISTPLMGVHSIDVNAGLVGGYQTGLLYLVFDYVNQETVWSGTTDAHPVLHGDYLYSFAGVRLKIKE